MLVVVLVVVVAIRTLLHFFGDYYQQPQVATVTIIATTSCCYNLTMAFFANIFVVVVTWHDHGTTTARHDHREITGKSLRNSH